MAVLHYVPLTAAVLLAGCAATPKSAAVAPPQTKAASAELVDAAGVIKARALLNDAGDGVDIVLRVAGMAPGTYAFHLHAAGTCTPPDFTSAGAHFNPTAATHGGHKGDLPNVVVGQKGVGRVAARIDGIRIAAGNTPILDPDGAAVIIHAKPDDGVTDPTGNAGPRLACGPIVTR